MPDDGGDDYECHVCSGGGDEVYAGRTGGSESVIAPGGVEFKNPSYQHHLYNPEVQTALRRFHRERT